MASSKTDIVLLVQRAQAGDREAFELLVQKYYRLVYAYVYRRLGHQELARDATQEVFLRLYHSLGSLQQRAKFFPWLFRVAHHVCCTFLKNKSRQPVAVDAEVEDLARRSDSHHSLSTVEASLQEKMFRQAVLDAIGELPENYQLPLMLRYLEEMSYDEIAETLEMTRGAVVGILFRGTRYLRHKLRDYWEDMVDHEP